MAKGGIGSRVSDLIIKQLEKRQQIVAKDGENARKSYLLSSNTPWIRLRSSVNQIDETVNLDDLIVEIEERGKIEATSTKAENFQLAGGTLEQGQTNARAGINRTPNEINSRYAYSNFNSEYGLGYRPMPGITDATIKSKGTFGTLSEANVSFKVFSVEDLELCELLYFRPGYTALLEWGHTVFANKDGAIRKTGIDTTTIGDSYFSKQSFEIITEEINNVKDQHEGNYDALFGFITNFSFDIEKDGSYNCSVKIVSSGAILEGLKTTKTSDVTSEEDDEKTEAENRKQKSIYHYVFHYLGLGKKTGEFSGNEKLKEEKQNSVNILLNDFQVFSYISDISGHFLGDQYDSNIPVQYIKLGDFLMMVNRLNSWRDPKKDPGKDDPDFILFDLSYGNKFVTFADHISCDPIVAMLPALATGETGDLNGKAAGTNIFQRIGLTDVKNAGEVYRTCRIVGLSKLMEDHARNSIATNEDGNEVGGLDDILNIYVSTYAIEKSINDIITGPQDQTVGMYNVIKDILNNIQGALGEINDFDLFYNYTSQKYQVVDRQSTVPGNLPVINMTGKNSIVSNINISSTISSAIASQVSIAAQGGGGGSTKENLSTMMEWNRGAVDRHLEHRGTDISQDDVEARNKKQAKYLKKLYNFFYKWNDGQKGGSSWWNSASNFVVGVVTNQDYIAEDIESLRSEITADMQKLRNFDTIARKKSVQGVVPVELSFDIDGIQGFLIGTTFKINKGLLPSKYNNWAFIITGIEHKVSKNRWITSVKTQFYPDRNADATSSDKLKASRNASNTSYKDNIDDVGKSVFIGNTPNADILRSEIAKLGYIEKGNQLSTGGDITNAGLDIGLAVSKKIKQLYPSMVLKFTSGNDLFHANLKGSLSRHKKGDGLDFTVIPPTTANVKKIATVLDSFAAGNNPNFSYINEYDNPSKFASGAHFHISWKAGGGSEGKHTIKRAVRLANKGKIPKYIV